MSDTPLAQDPRIRKIPAVDGGTPPANVNHLRNAIQSALNRRPPDDDDDEDDDDELAGVDAVLNDTRPAARKVRPAQVSQTPRTNGTRGMGNVDLSPEHITLCFPGIELSLTVLGWSETSDAVAFFLPEGTDLRPALHVPIVITRTFNRREQVMEVAYLGGRFEFSGTGMTMLSFGKAAVAPQEDA